nr:PREDICTED: agmatinase, mitochondrial isoform X2 [Lepisosteus oculatus]
MFKTFQVALVINDTTEGKIKILQCKTRTSAVYIEKYISHKSMGKTSLAKGSPYSISSTHFQLCSSTILRGPQLSDPHLQACKMFSFVKLLNRASARKNFGTLLSTRSSCALGTRDFSAGLTASRHVAPGCDEAPLPRSAVQVPSRRLSGSRYNVPPSAEFVARPSGIATMCKLPFQQSAEGLDAAFIGVPIDTGTSNRPGARFGPRQIRAESALLRQYCGGTRAAPYESLVVADIGDVNVNVYDLKDTCKRIREAYREIMAAGCVPLTLGGDHTISYPILQAVAEKHGPVGLIHVDAHADTSDVVLGEKIGHGTPFRRCVEEGLLDCGRVAQIGLRGSAYSADAYRWNREQGFRVVPAEECWSKSLTPLMADIRQQVGGGPVYLSFDIDALDPAFAPGTGTPEIAGLTPIQALEIIRGCRGLRLVGCDLVEVSPPYDTTGNTALTAANLLFEMMCVLPKVKYY